jgi:uncharacterized DUF497 family protein
VDDIAYEFDWDPAKAAANLTKHGVDFRQAATVFSDPLALTVFDEAHSQSEERWFTLGMTSEGRLVAVAHTFEQTTPTQARIRIISVREATGRERNDYQERPR